MLINIDYKFKKVEGQEIFSNSDVTLDLITFSVNQKYKDGLEGQLRRTWNRIVKKFDEAIDSKKDSIELEQAEIDFIKKTFNEAKFPVVNTKPVCILEEEIEKLGK
jgi:hypothetical protein